MSNLHTKSISLETSSLKFEDQSRTIEGYAAVFGNVDSQGDVIEPGAFKGTLLNRERPVALQWNHGQTVIGKWLDLREDSTGLYAKGQLTPGHSQAEDTYALLKHGAISGLSIGYYVPPGGSEIKQGINYLKQLDLVEISVVNSPANPQALISSVKTDLTSERELEKALRNLGLSRRQTKRFMSEGWSGLLKTDADEEVEETLRAMQNLIEAFKA